ncbi:protein of unknown function [Methylocaldum szegediense]|uniref:Uncharacterized protein n=1 Tax=Methylocaldum szegediense TaxID=73780 RepID=A0ABM9I6R5_9GAMM|nr:protein of unknown function [Methylocaldum szegediense]
MARKAVCGLPNFSETGLQALLQLRHSGDFTAGRGLVRAAALARSVPPEKLHGLAHEDFCLDRE